MAAPMDNPRIQLNHPPVIPRQYYLSLQGFLTWDNNLVAAGLSLTCQTVNLLFRFNVTVTVRRVSMRRIPYLLLHLLR